MNTIDSDAASALAEARVASARMTAHETECARRYAEAAAALTKLDDRLNQLSTRMMAAGITAALTLAGFLAQALLKFATWKL